MIACSEIGVDLTRSSPYLVDRPLVTPITPPSCGSATSSPSTRTFGSASIASCSARFSASTIVILVASVILSILSRVSGDFFGEHVALQFGNIGERRVDRGGERLVDGGVDVALDP